MRKNEDADGLSDHGARVYLFVSTVLCKFVWKRCRNSFFHMSHELCSRKRLVLRGERTVTSIEGK